MKSLLLISALLFSFYGFASDGSVSLAVTLKPMGSFEAKTTLLKIKGKTERIKDGFSAENIIVDASSFKTGIELRDKHMREKYLEADQFPEMTLVRGKATQGAFTGELTVHGVTQSVQGKYEVKDNHLIVRFPVKASSFKIAPAKYMGVGVQDDIQVEAMLPIKAGGT